MSQAIRPTIGAMLSLVLFCERAFAQVADQGAQEPSFGQMLFSMLPMIAIVYLIFYFLVTKPQQTKLRQHAQMLKELKKSENVVTSGGIIGRVAGIEKDYILLEVAPNVKVRVETAHIAKRVESKGSTKSED